MAVAEPYPPPASAPVRWRAGRPRRPGTTPRASGASRARKRDIAAASLVGIITLVAVLAPVLAPYSTIQPVGLPQLPPGSGGFLLGTDAIGRDILSRVLIGWQSSWFAALAVIASGLFIGGLIGLIAGTIGGVTDTILMRVTDGFLALPAPVLAIAVVAALGPGLVHTLVAVAIVWWPFYARIVGGEIRSLRARPHVEAARLAGAGRLRIAVRHLLPGAIPAAVVTASLDVGNLVLTLAALSFLGLGQPQPAAELGADTARNLPYLLQEWWIPVMPGLAVMIMALASNIAGDGVRNLLGGPVIALIAKRLGAAIVIVVALSAVMFILQKVSPVDPVHAMLGPTASPAAIAHEEHVLGLDRPVIAQFGSYLTGLLHGNLGMSYRTRRPVSTDLGSFVPATAELSLYGLASALILAVILAVGSTLRWPGATVFRLLLMAGASTPAFLLAIAGILLFYSKLGWLPATGRTSYVNPPAGPTGLLTLDGLLHGEPAVTLDALRHLVMPALAVAVVPAVSIGRVLRSSLLGGMQSDYVRTARAKGLSERSVVFRHVLRNCLSAALSMTGLQVGLMFSGVLVIEEIFAWPGIGQYMAQAIPAADFPAISGVTLLLGVGYVAVNTIVDILQAVADPRIKL